MSKDSLPIVGAGVILRTLERVSGVRVIFIPKKLVEAHHLMKSFYSIASFEKTVSRQTKHSDYHEIVFTNGSQLWMIPHKDLNLALRGVRGHIVVLDEQPDDESVQLVVRPMLACSANREEPIYPRGVYVLE